jgi:hypothetical protein
MRDAMVAAWCALATACDGMRLLSLAAFATATSAASLSPDYAREARWAREIEPSVVIGEPVYLAAPSQPRVLALYTEAADAKGGVIVIHGAGLHPDWGLIGGLRTGLADAGFTTLSVQMPVLGADALRDEYNAIIPQAIVQRRYAARRRRSLTATHSDPSGGASTQISLAPRESSVRKLA